MGIEGNSESSFFVIGSREGLLPLQEPEFQSVLFPSFSVLFLKGMAVDHYGHPMTLKWDPKNLEIRTMSVEKTLEPLVVQVSFKESSWVALELRLKDWHLTF